MRHVTLSYAIILRICRRIRIRVAQNERSKITALTACLKYHLLPNNTELEAVKDVISCHVGLLLETTSLFSLVIP
jgi:hypothetical protein